MAEVTTALLKARRTVGDVVEHDVEFRDASGEVVSVGSGGDTYVTNVANEADDAPEGDFVPSERTVNGKSLAEDVVLYADDIEVGGSSDTLEAVLAELKSQIAALEERVAELETAPTD